MAWTLNQRDKKTLCRLDDMLLYMKTRLWSIHKIWTTVQRRPKLDKLVGWVCVAWLYCKIWGAY